MREIDSIQREENNPVPDFELNLVPTAEDMPEMAIALIREEGSSRVRGDGADRGVLVVDAMASCRTGRMVT